MLKKIGMESLLIFSHIFSGATALLTGLILMLRPKGTQTHIRLGWVYATSMFTICLSALTMISFFRFSFFLMVIAVLTFYSTFVGVRVTRRKKADTEKWYDWGAAVITCLFALGLFGYAIHIFNIAGWHWVAVLSLVFGSLTFANGWRDLLFFYNRKTDHPQWWLHNHINAMGGSYIAAVTAFVVQNGDAWLPGSSFQWLFWVLPGAIGGSIIGRVIRKHKRDSLPQKTL